MTSMRSQFSRAILPLGILAAVVCVHFIWHGVYPERDPAQSRWVEVASIKKSWLKSYVESQSYWLGLSYGMSIAFAAVAFREYRERKARSAKNMAIGGMTFSALLSVVGCFMIGCCGSPMLGVYLNLFGAAFVPLAKPLMAAMTAVSIGFGWWWMKRNSVRLILSTDGSCPDASCGCASEVAGTNVNINKASEHLQG